MKTLDLTPLYRNTVGFDRFGSLLDNFFSEETVSTNYPPYNIEVLDENRYAITLAIAGFSDDELDISVEKGVLKVSGKKENQSARKYLHQGIANRAFEHKFNLADYIEVVNAKLQNGLLAIELKKEVPEAMKPKKISIDAGANKLESQTKAA